MKKKQEKEYFNITTPIGICSYPYLAKPDTGRAESSNKYSIEIYVPKATWAKEGKNVVETILKCAREFFGDPKIKKLSDFKGPITDMDTVKDAKDWQKGTVRIRAKAKQENKPTVIGPQKDPNTDRYIPWNDEQIAAIKGGDEVRIFCGVYGYSQQGGGIALGLNFVQFAKEGKAIGQGRLKQLENIDEIEVTLDSSDGLTPDEESDEDTDPAMQFG